MDDVTPVLSLLGGGGGALMLKVLWDRFIARSEDAVAARERERDEQADRHETRLEALHAALTEIRGQLSVISTSAAFSAAEFRRLDERQEGMSTNYGSRLAKVEADIVRLETLMDARRSPPC